jgi:hypothetical protein
VTTRSAWCLLFVLIRQGLRWGFGPQRWIRALGKETGNPIMALHRPSLREMKAIKIPPTPPAASASFTIFGAFGLRTNRACSGAIRASCMARHGNALLAQLRERERRLLLSWAKAGKDSKESREATRPSEKKRTLENAVRGSVGERGYGDNCRPEAGAGRMP